MISAATRRGVLLVRGEVIQIRVLAKDRPGNGHLECGSIGRDPAPAATAVHEECRRRDRPVVGLGAVASSDLAMLAKIALEESPLLGSILSSNDAGQDRAHQPLRGAIGPTRTGRSDESCERREVSAVSKVVLVLLRPPHGQRAGDGHSCVEDRDAVEPGESAGCLQHDEPAVAVAEQVSRPGLGDDGGDVVALRVDAVVRSLRPAGATAPPLDHVDGERRCQRGQRAPRSPPRRSARRGRSRGVGPARRRRLRSACRRER